MINKLNLSDFLPSYPEFDDDVGEILGYDIVNKPSSATWDIYQKKEFYDYRLKKIEGKPDRPGKYMNHQTIVSRFMSSNTFYDGLLLFHSVGTGKTCSSVAIIEGIKNENSTFKGALVIMKGQGLINNYKNELVNYCTDGIYKPEEYDTEMEKVRRTNKKLETFYQFETFEIFSKLINNTREDILREKYSNMIICIDEIHNLRISDDKSQYHSIHKFLHTVRNCKIIIMSGTPMRDQPQEIAGVMNLILPLDKQLPIEKAFVEKFLIRQGDSMVVNPKMAQELKRYFRGRVSYVGTMESDVEREFMGEKLINYFNLYAVEPSDFQMEAYKRAYEIDLNYGGDKKGRGVYNNSSQASLFVFPDGSWGEVGFKKYVTSKKTMDLKGKEKISYHLSKELLAELSGKTNEEKLSKIRKFSAKYADDIEKILKNRDECQFVYLEFVGGSGAILFSKLLGLFGLGQAIGGEKTTGRRYALITGKSSKAEITRILETQNNPANMTGKYINVVIGSQVIGEGFTLKNIQSIYVLTPHWNFSETDQGIARGLRLFSHRDLENAGIKVNVKIYLYCLGMYPLEDSIDFKMYKTSEDKDISIK
jgi:superfamily II DNA or RNA helicase